MVMPQTYTKETHKMENKLQRGYMLIVCDLTHAQSDILPV